MSVLDERAVGPAGAEEMPARVPGESVRNVSLRCVVIGLLLVPLNVYWVIVAELRWYMVLTLNPLFVTPVFYLFVLIGANAVLRRLVPRHALQPAELVVIYIMLVMSCTIATHDFIINLMSSMGWMRWMATPQNNWETQVFPHMPKWLFVWDKQLLTGCFQGGKSLYEPAVLKMWLAPLAFWSVFIFCVAWIMLCMTVILRKAWTEETKLSFPIVRLPLEMTGVGSGEGFFLSHAMWAGFAFAAGLDLLNGLRMWFPNLPDLKVSAHFLSFPNAPWNAAMANGFVTSYYPFAIGLAYLVPLDVSFSCWFFYLFSKAQMVVGSMLGYGGVPGSPFPMEQGIGAWTAFGVALLYTMRGYLRNALRIALDPSTREDAGEPVSYRVAFWGLIAGCLVFLAFWRAAGMNPIWALLVLVLYLLLSICITRVRAEAGGQHTVWDLEPMNVFRLFDSRALGPATMAAGAISHWYWRLNRSHMMPNQMEAFRLAKEHRIGMRSLVAPMLLAVVVATVFGMWACLQVFYKDGALARCQGFATWSNGEWSNWLSNSLTNGFRPEATRWGAVGAAAAFVVVLSWLRTQFAWFPLHPLGYCIGPGLLWLWCPFMIAWAIKLVILRYGGLALYRKTLPFFLGLVLGDYTAGAVWSLIEIVFNVPTLQIFH